MRSPAQLDRDFDQLAERVRLIHRVVDRVVQHGTVHVRQPGGFA